MFHPNGDKSQKKKPDLREPVPEQWHEEQGKDIHIINVGFDQSKLEPIISALMQPESKD